jgi:hypothetical protein
VLRIDSSGNYDAIPVFTSTCGGWAGGASHAYVGGGNLITNADQGILLTWEVDGSPEATAQTATITNGAAATVGTPQVPGGEQVYPVLQAQDGSFVGTTCQGCAPGYGNMVSFDASGNTRWIVPGDTPQIATADGGVIGQSGITYDQYGNATGMIPNMPTYSWTGNAYTDGPVDSVISAMVDVALSFDAFADGSPSPNGAAVKVIRSPMFIPFAITLPTGVNSGNDYDIEPGQRAVVAAYYVNTVQYLGPAQLALYPLAFERATAARFLGALGTTNTIVGYIDHGLEEGPPGQATTRALCFWRWCLAPSELRTWVRQGPDDPGELLPPQGAQLAVLPNGFTPKAKVVILAACGIDAFFIAQWHLQDGQALIVPKYNDDNPLMEITLNTASTELEAMLLKLGKGGTVDEAVAFGNQAAAANNSDYRWQVVPTGGGGVSFNAKTQ